MPSRTPNSSFFSSPLSANASPYVLREIERAVAYERPVLSVRLDGAPPSPSLEYYLNLLQWLDAPRGIESRRPEIVAAVQKAAGGGPRSGEEWVVRVRGGAPLLPPPRLGGSPPPPMSAPRGRAQAGHRPLRRYLRLHRALREADPEALRDLITACFDRLVPCIERYGGTIDKFIGDEIMALFGAPQAHENDPERALRAALEMREAPGRLQPRGGVVPVASTSG